MRRRVLEGPLSPDQLAAVRLAASGYSARQIAARLGATESAIHQRLNQIALAVGARSRAHLVAIALCRGLIRPGELELPEAGFVSASSDMRQHRPESGPSAPLSGFQAPQVPQEGQALQRASESRVAVPRRSTPAPAAHIHLDTPTA